MYAISSYRGNRPTNKHTNTHAARPPVANTPTDRTDINTLHR